MTVDASLPADGSTLMSTLNSLLRETRAALVDRVKRILGPETDLPKAAIAFCLAFDAVSTVIPGSASLAQLQGNLEAAEQPLSPALVSQLVEFYQNEVRELGIPW